MNEWLKIIQERDDRIKELETNFQKWSNEDRDKIRVLQDRLQEAERRGDENYEHLQNVISVRDALLTHVYTLLDRPNGIMLHDMPDAITQHKAYIAQLEAEIRAAKQSSDDDFGSMTCHRRSR